MSDDFEKTPTKLYITLVNFSKALGRHLQASSKWICWWHFLVVSVWVLTHSNHNPATFSVPSGTEKLNKFPGKQKAWESLLESEQNCFQFIGKIWCWIQNLQRKQKCACKKKKHWLLGENRPTSIFEIEPSKLYFISKAFLRANTVTP